MSGFLLRGLLVEYSGDFLGPIPNIVFFQFNPEQIARTIVIPEPPGAAAAGGAREREPAHTSAPPTESFTLTAHFSAADDLGRNDGSSAIPRVFGVGPQLAALEKMVYPAGPVSGLLAQAIDAIGDALGGGGGDDEAPTRATPRESVPRLLFIWGPSRVLPVRITSMTLTEQKFDAFLNPVQAEVQVGLEVLSFSEGTSDKVGKGALTYTRAIKDVQAVANLAKAVETAVDIVTF